MRETNAADTFMELVTPTLDDITRNPRVRKFVRAYDGDLVYALRVAGFQGTDQFLIAKGKDLLKDPAIQYMIQMNLEQSEKREGVLLTKIERMEFLSSIVRNSDPYERMIKDDYGQEVPPPPPTMPERLKALDMYNKMEGDYHTNVNVNHNVSIQDMILSSYTEVTRPIEAIEADYTNVDKVVPELSTLGL